MQYRVQGLTYRSKLKGERAAEEAFTLTNAPEEYLTDEQIALLKELNFHGPALLVGDIVRVEPIIKKQRKNEYFMCESQGWSKFKGDVIELLKHINE